MKEMGLCLQVVNRDRWNGQENGYGSCYIIGDCIGASMWMHFPFPYGPSVSLGLVVNGLGPIACYLKCKVWVLRRIGFREVALDPQANIPNGSRKIQIEHVISPLTQSDHRRRQVCAVLRPIRSKSQSISRKALSSKGPFLRN